MTEQQPTYRPVEPYSASFEGYTAHADDWPNTVSVEAVTGYDPRNKPDPVRRRHLCRPAWGAGTRQD
jgi:hypothetical protein